MTETKIQEKKKDRDTEDAADFYDWWDDLEFQMMPKEKKIKPSDK